MNARGARVLSVVLPLFPGLLRSVSSYAEVRLARPGRIERAAARDPLAIDAWGRHRSVAD